jgi:chaperonin GroES
MAAKFTPLHDRILVRRVEEAETTRGGIIIPDTAKDMASYFVEERSKVR